MADGISLPPWLNVNPAQSAEFFLHGYGQGASAGAAARAASQRDEELAFHEQQAQQLDAIRQQEAQLNADKFGLDLREKQRAAEREAQEAAMQLEGQQQLSKDLAAGKPIHEALAAAGPKLFYRHPEKMFQALHQVTPPPTPQPGWSPSGAEYMTDARGGVHFTPASDTGDISGGGTPAYDPVTGRYLGTRIRTGPRTGTFVRATGEGKLSDVDKEELSAMREDAREIGKTMNSIVWPAMKDTPEGKELIQRLGEIKKRREEIRKKAMTAITAPPKSGPAATGAKAPSSPADVQEIIRQANEAIAKGKDPEVIKERLKRMGIDVGAPAAPVAPGGFDEEQDQEEE